MISRVNDTFLTDNDGLVLMIRSQQCMSYMVSYGKGLSYSYILLSQGWDHVEDRSGESGFWFHSSLFLPQLLKNNLVYMLF